MARPTFVLVGGEAYEWQGVEPERREFQHTSVEFVGSAYESLRSAGVPREDIITIVQLSDYLSTLARGEAGEFSESTGVPAKWYAEQREKTEGRCRRLIDEGGASYDNEDVNPATVWSVLLGEEGGDGGGGPGDGVCGPVVPIDGGPILFGVYSHGDRHAAGPGSGATECFAHMPYASTRLDIYDFVATDGAQEAGRGRNRPTCYLYSTQLRVIFHQLFERSPDRCIVGLLNYCLSGGNLEFMRRESVRRHLHVDRWPLFLMSSSQAGQESMVAGMWDAWFQELRDAIIVQPPSLTVSGLFERAEARYWHDNLYELSNAVKARVYAPRIWSRSFCFPGVRDDSWDPWHLDLTRALEDSIPGPGGSFSFDAVTELQRRYEAGEAFALVKQATPQQRDALLRAGGIAIDDESQDVIVWTACAHGDWTGLDAQQLAAMQPAPYAVRLVEYAGTQETGLCRNLAGVLRKAIGEVAHPEEVHGAESGIADRELAGLLLPEAV